LHDEAAAFAAGTAELRAHRSRLDWLAGLASFKAVFLEGLEVAFIVIAGVALRRPLARVPENTLKLAVGVMLSAFGVFWTGEGLGVAWPGADLAIVGFGAVFLAVGIAAAIQLRRKPEAAA